MKKTGNGDNVIRGISARLHDFLAQARSVQVLSYVVPVLMLVLAIIFIGHELERHISDVETWIAQLGPWGIVTFVLLFALATSCLVPDTVLGILAGALFGMGWGLVAMLAAGLLAAGLQYGLSRSLLRARIQHMLSARPSLAAIQRAVIQDELRLQILLRLTPLNPATISYLLGAAGVRFSGFLFAYLAHSPHLLVEVYFGHAGKNVVHLAGANAQAAHLHDLMLVGGLLLSIVVLVLVSRMARRALMQAVDRSSEDARSHLAGTLDREFSGHRGGALEGSGIISAQDLSFLRIVSYACRIRSPVAKDEA